MFVLLVFSTSLMAANVTIKAKNESLKSVLEKITQQTGYEFAYSNAINPNSIKVNVEVTNQDSDVFLKNSSANMVLFTKFQEKQYLYPNRILQTNNHNKKILRRTRK